jgi:hypothetical protein
VNEVDGVKIVVLSSEKIARDTCYQLVRLGRVFTVFKVEDGWQFEVLDD